MHHNLKYPDNWKEIALLVKQRDNFTCQECGREYPYNSPFLHVHHKVPLSKGGTNTSDNLITLCRNCHTNHHEHMQKKVKYNYKFKPLRR